MINAETLEQIDADILVVGGGMAGILAAARAADFSDRVILVDKAKVSRSGCSPFAAGIYNAFFPGDDEDVWMKEIIESGDFLSDQEWVRQWINRSHPLVVQVDEWARKRRKVAFEKNPDGTFVRKRSRAHILTQHIVIHPIPCMDALRRRAKHAGVRFIERTSVSDLFLDSSGRAIGALGFDYRQGKLYLFRAKAIVLAAGGCGFKSIFMGHKNLTGDLQAAAFRVGVTLRNVEQCQSNTCHRDTDIHGMNLFVNVGGKFLNAVDEEFMWQYHPVLGNRAGLKDLVLAFSREVVEGRGPIYLDITAAKPEDQALCRKILIETFMAWDKAGIDPFSQRLEWVPAFYGTIGSSGGVHIDLKCRTNVPGIFAVGDVTPNPASGPSALGGIALGFAAVSGYISGEIAPEFAAEVDLGNAKVLWEQGRAAAERFVQPFGRSGVSPDDLITEIQKTVIRLPVAYLKERSALEGALQRLGELRSMAQDLGVPEDLHELQKVNEARSILEIAELFLRSSLFREESRGFHFREDYPRLDNREWLNWVTVQRRGEQTAVWADPVPLPYHRPAVEYATPPSIRRA